MLCHDITPTKFTPVTIELVFQSRDELILFWRITSEAKRIGENLYERRVNHCQSDSKTCEQMLVRIKDQLDKYMKGNKLS